MKKQPRKQNRKSKQKKVMMDELSDMISMEIRSARKECGWTQEELAFKASTSRSYIGTIEIGLRTPSLQLLQHLAKMMGYKLRIELVKGDDYA